MLDGARKITIKHGSGASALLPASGGFACSSCARFVWPCDGAKVVCAYACGDHHWDERGALDLGSRELGSAALGAGIRLEIGAPAGEPDAKLFKKHERVCAHKKT